jgi:capsular polysaccharide biosynthesis protein
VTMLDHGAEAASSQGTPASNGAVAPSAPVRQADAGDLSSYARSARRSLRGAMIGAMLGLVAGIALLLSPSQYTATSTVRIFPFTSDDTRSASGLIDPATEAAVAQSDAVFETAVSNGSLDVDVDTLREAVAVTTIEASTVLEIAVTADSVDDAQVRADAVAVAYLEYRASSAGARQDDLIADLEAMIAAVDAERTAAGDRFKAAPRGSVTRQQALAEHSAALAQRDSLQAQLETLPQLDAAGGEVLTSAESVSPSITPDRRLTLSSSLVGGAVLGFLTAFMLGQFSSRVRRLDDLSKIPSLRFTADLGRSGRKKGSADIAVFRALREQRKIDGWPEVPYTTVLALDLRRSPSLDTALALARTLAQEHGAATLVALGWQPDQQETELDALGFRRASTGYTTHDEPPVGLRTFQRDDSLQVADPFLTNSASDALESMNSTARPIVVWCPGQCGESTRLALLARSDTLLLTLEPKTSRLSDLRQVSIEALDADVTWAGALLVR